MKTFKPLSGIRVLSFEIAFALPAGTRALHDLGAEVVRVAPPERNVDRYIGIIDGVFHGKPCISIDLTTEQGRKVAFDLAQQADVVCNNFRPSVLTKYGLGADTLRAAKAELIILQLSGYGTPGPWSDFPAFGPSTEAAGGLNRLLVNEGEVPIRIGTGVFSDQLAGRHAALAVCAALQKRKETGAGATIDLSMTACITHMLGELMTRASIDNATPTSFGNRDPRFVPQGIYRCSGEDEWISISVTTDRAWREFAALLDDPAADENASRETRWENHDQIDAAVETWTRTQNKDALAATLQSLGIAAAPVRTVEDSAIDPQFKARGALVDVVHSRPRLGYRAHPHPPLPWRIVGRRRKTLTDYRHTGVDNERVLSAWLGLSSDDVAALERNGALHRAPPLELNPRPIHDEEFGNKLGLKT